MNDDEISQRLRVLPRRAAPASWRREVLAVAEAVPPTRPRSWWAWLPAPRRPAWGALAAAWLLIFWLGLWPASPSQPNAPAPEELRTLLLSRQREFAEPRPPDPLPAARPTSAHPAFPILHIS